MIYADFPGCLSTYAWLVEDGLRDPARMFNASPPHYCKCCGEAIARPSWSAHVRAHASELRDIARRRQRENMHRLRVVSRLRRETSAR